MRIKNIVLTLSIIVICVSVIIGLIKVNMINSKTLSPLVKQKEFLNLDEREILDSYCDFIKDEAMIKIYKEDYSDILIRISDKDYRIKLGSDVGEYAKNIFEKIEVLFSGL